MSGEHEGQPDGWNVTSLMISPDYDLKKLQGQRQQQKAQVAPERAIFQREAEEDSEPSAQEQPDGWHTTSLTLDVGEARALKAAASLKSAMSTGFWKRGLDCVALEHSLGEARAAALPPAELEAAEAALATGRAADKARCERELRDKMKARPLLGVDKAGLAKALTRAIQAGLSRDLLEAAAAKLPEASRPEI